jgi:hypothetical protein
LEKCQILIFYINFFTLKHIQLTLDSVAINFKNLKFAVKRTRNVRHGHMCTKTAVTFTNINTFEIRFLFRLEYKISEILSGCDH